MYLVDNMFDIKSYSEDTEFMFHLPEDTRFDFELEYHIFFL
jgi:hypothetical protein